jgi:hypothetical protein
MPERSVWTHRGTARQISRSSIMRATVSPRHRAINKSGAVRMNP